LIDSLGLFNAPERETRARAMLAVRSSGNCGALRCRSFPRRHLPTCEDFLEWFELPASSPLGKSIAAVRWTRSSSLRRCAQRDTSLLGAHGLPIEPEDPSLRQTRLTNQSR